MQFDNYYSSFTSNKTPSLNKMIIIQKLKWTPKDVKFLINTEQDSVTRSTINQQNQSNSDAHSKLNPPNQNHTRSTNRKKRKTSTSHLETRIKRKREIFFTTNASSQSIFFNKIYVFNFPFPATPVSKFQFFQP